jgi:superfamily II DNA or RNA helicase
MKLRFWQQECIETALARYVDGHRHFLCLATPGAGKSLMAATLGKQLLNQRQIDFILCFSPSLTVAQGLKETFGRQLKGGFDGEFGDVGTSLTYQAMLNLPEKFWSLLRRFRVFVVFDEIHHCAGDEAGLNAWGQVILRRIQEHARFTLALTGTPWRSDQLRIAMAKYSQPDGRILLDYSYSLRQAIQDKVCRIPHIVLIDNNKITVNNGSVSAQFGSFASALDSGEVRFQQMLFNPDAQRFVLRQAVQKLTKLQQEHRPAAGLVVAANIAHAYQLAQLLSKEFGQTSVVVTYNDPNAQQKIEHFRTSSDSWIVSVGMIAEGTDIPRLRVCCLLSLARTELFLRQVLGRVLRLLPNMLNNSGWLYCLAEPNLTRYAEQLELEIPEQQVTTRLNMNSEIAGSKSSNTYGQASRGQRGGKEKKQSELLLEGMFQPHTTNTAGINDQELLSVWMQGKFTERVLALIG